KEWLAWAKSAGVRPDVIAFIVYMPHALQRPVPNLPVPFSTPRAWAALARALDLAEKADVLTTAARRALAFGRLSAQDAAVFCAVAEEGLGELRPVEDYLRDPALLPESDTARWFIIHRMRTLATRNEFPAVPKDVVNSFLTVIPNEFRFALLVDL